MINLRRNIGLVLLAVWLILTGLLPLLNFGFVGLARLMQLLAVVAGIFILIGR